MTTRRSFSIYFAAIITSGLFLLGCSNTPKPTAVDSSEIQGKLTALGGNKTRSVPADTFHPNNVMASMMGGMHSVPLRDSLHAGGMLTGIGADTMHSASMMGMMSGGHNAGAMTSGKEGTTQEDKTPDSPSSPSEPSPQVDSHSH